MTNNIYIVGPKTTIHVYEGMKCMGIYDKESGVPKFTTGFDRLDNQLRVDGADRDGDLVEIPKKKRVVKIIRDDTSEFTDDELLDLHLLARDSYRPNWKASEFNRITSEMLDLYSRKNTDYGGSFDESLDEDGLLVAKIRLKDKLNRFSQLISNDALVDNETMKDTLIDLANYTVMTLMWLDDNEHSD